MMISTKAFLKKPDSKGISRIYIHYSAGDRTDAVSLDMTIHFSMFDPVKGFAKAISNEAASINKAIYRASNLLETIAADKPDSELIKKTYLERSADQKLKGLGRHGRTAKVKAQALNEDMKKYHAGLKIQQKIEALQQQISQLQEEQKELNVPGFIGKRD